MKADTTKNKRFEEAKNLSKQIFEDQEIDSGSFKKVQNSYVDTHCPVLIRPLTQSNDSMILA
jgi:hypothetical protein